VSDEINETDVRREKFIADIIDVCKKHKVMMDPDGSEWLGMDADLISFLEADPSKSELFTVEISEIEEAVRIAVWPDVHPEKVDYAADLMIDCRDYPV
jgi:hypothetical protein